MRAVVSRVEHATVAVDGRTVGQTGRGLLVYIAIITGDGPADAAWMAEKLLSLRVFGDEAGKMNLCVRDIGGGLLLIPNFTLAGRTRKGTRPSFSDAAPPEAARELFEQITGLCRQETPTASGIFGAHMLIDSRADGPVTVILDSRDS